MRLVALLQHSITKKYSNATSCGQNTIEESSLGSLRTYFSLEATRSLHVYLLVEDFETCRVKSKTLQLVFDNKTPKKFTVSWLVLDDVVGYLGVTGTGYLSVQNCLGDLQHASLGHPDQGICHQPRASVTLHVRGTARRGFPEHQQCQCKQIFK